VNPIRNIFKRLLTKIYLLVIIKLHINKFTFSYVYYFNIWGNSKSKSGDGSTSEYTENIRNQLPILFKKYDIKSVLDAPCGDFQWFNEIVENSSFEYTGIDVVPAIINKNAKKYSDNKRIKFLQRDLLNYKYKQYDFVLVRDFLFHLSFNDTYKFLVNFVNSNSKFLLTTSHSSILKNEDIDTGSFRKIDLFLAPYFFTYENNEKIKDFISPYPERYLFLFSKAQVESALIKQTKFFKEK
jgi:SAM-dependent methyltransferase